MSGRIVVIGGASRLAGALRRVLPFGTRFVARGPACPPDCVDVGDYRTVRPALFEGADLVINCAGLVRGDDALLQAANADVPGHLATVARQAGVSRFVQVSSFAVLGSAQRINASTVPRPVNGYGTSKLTGEAMVAKLATSSFATASVRLPAIVGLGGNDKLARLIRLWSRVRYLPVPREDIARSMISGTLAARVLAAIAEGDEVGIVHAADPAPFTYAGAATVISEHTGRRIGMMHLPSAVTAALARMSPDMFRSLYGNSILSPDLNRAATMPSDLYQTIGRLAQREFTP